MFVFGTPKCHAYFNWQLVIEKNGASQRFRQILDGSSGEKARIPVARRQKKIHIRDIASTFSIGLMSVRTQRKQQPHRLAGRRNDRIDWDGRIDRKKKTLFLFFSLFLFIMSATTMMEDNTVV